MYIRDLYLIKARDQLHIKDLNYFEINFISKSKPEINFISRFKHEINLYLKHEIYFISEINFISISNPVINFISRSEHERSSSYQDLLHIRDQFHQDLNPRSTSYQDLKINFISRSTSYQDLNPRSTSYQDLNPIYFISKINFISRSKHEINFKISTSYLKRDLLHIRDQLHIKI